MPQFLLILATIDRGRRLDLVAAFCLVPVVKFAVSDKNTGMKVSRTPLVNRWFARSDGSLFLCAGNWRPWMGDRGTKAKSDVGQDHLYSF